MNLEFSLYQGEIKAAYLTLSNREWDKSVRTTQPSPGIVVDWSEDDRPIGIEILVPQTPTVGKLNEILKSIGHRELLIKDYVELFNSTEDSPT